MPMGKSATLAGLQRDGAKRLRDARVESAALDARLLLCAAANISHETLVAQGQNPATPEIESAFIRLIDRRRAGEPVARILGEKEFWGLPFGLGDETLVPRPDSECIVAAALETIEDKDAGANVLDLGTGSGCLLLALLSELPNAQGIGADLSQGAVDTARDNALRLGMGPRAQFVQSDWTNKVEGTFDIIISNPPYIPSAEIESLDIEVREHDPRRALDGGVDGFECYRSLLNDAPPLLKSGGALVLETSPDLYAELFDLAVMTPGLSPPEGIKDLAGRWRGIRARQADFSR